MNVYERSEEAWGLVMREGNKVRKERCKTNDSNELLIKS